MGNIHTVIRSSDTSDIRTALTIKAIPRVSPTIPPPNDADSSGRYSVITPMRPSAPMSTELAEALSLLDQCYRFIPDGHELGIEVGKFLVRRR
jgi:hypothetical protein